MLHSFVWPETSSVFVENNNRTWDEVWNKEERRWERCVGCRSSYAVLSEEEKRPSCAERRRGRKVRRQSPPRTSTLSGWKWPGWRPGPRGSESEIPGWRRDSSYSVCEKPFRASSPCFWTFFLLLLLLRPAPPNFSLWELFFFFTFMRVCACAALKGRASDIPVKADVRGNGAQSLFIY